MAIITHFTLAYWENAATYFRQTLNGKAGTKALVRKIDNELATWPVNENGLIPIRLNRTERAMMNAFIADIRVIHRDTDNYL